MKPATRKPEAKENTLSPDTPKHKMITGSKVRLRHKELKDARNDHAWQTDAELARLDAAPVLNLSLREYLSIYPEELRHYASLNRHPFAIETLDGRHIGNCVYYNINKIKGEAEVGVMIGERSYWDKGYGADALTTLVNHIFQQTNLKRVFLKTLDWNKRAQRCFRKCGFKPCGRLSKERFSFLLMEFQRTQWEKQQI